MLGVDKDDGQLVAVCVVKLPVVALDVPAEQLVTTEAVYIVLLLKPLNEALVEVTICVD